MRRHALTFAATVTALAVTLAACSPGSEAGSGGDAQQAEDKNLTYVYFTDGPDEQATRNLIAEFEKQTGAKVNLQIVPFANLEQQLQARLSGGNAPDVARLSDITPFRGDLLDLNQYEKKALDGTFIDGAKSYTTGPGGELIAVPSDLTMNGPLINVDQFTKAGVALPDASKPWTWTEFVDAAKKVQQANKTEYAIAMDVSGHRFATMLSQYGTTYFSADNKVAMDKAKALPAVKKFADLNASGAMPKDVWLQAGSKYKGANDIFLAQQVPVYISGNWQISAFEKSAKFNWRAAPNPCQDRCGGFPGGKFMVSFKKSQRQKLAAQFIAWMNSAESQTKMCQQASFLPTRKDLIDKGIEFPNRGADMKVFLDGIKQTPEDTYANVYNPAFGNAAKSAVNELAKVLAGQSTPEAAVDAIRTGAEKALETAKK
jgi:alpha-1,4-digalacturonate transport system substrate-binding protein